MAFVDGLRRGGLSIGLLAVFRDSEAKSAGENHHAAPEILVPAAQGKPG